MLRSGGASQPFKDAGWEVVTVDIEPKYKPDIVADVRTWRWNGPRPDFIWASPPCTEFSRESMPWSKTGKHPDMSIVLACKRIIEDARPKYWAIENVRGAIRYFKPYFGRPKASFGPFYLWGFFPLEGHFSIVYKNKERYSSNRPELRAMLPYCVGETIRNAIETQLPLFPEEAIL